MRVFHRRVVPVVGLLGAVVLLSAVGLTARQYTRDAVAAGGMVEHTHQVIERLLPLWSSVSAAESAVRGYAATRDAALLARVQPALDEASFLDQQVRELTHDNLDQQRRLRMLEPALKARLGLLQRHMIALRDAVDPGISPEDVRLSGVVRGLVAEMVAAERLLLDVRYRIREQDYERLRRMALLEILATIALVIGAFAMLTAEMARGQRTAGELSLKHGLLDSVIEGTTDPIYVRDLAGGFILANSACASLFRRSADEMRGMSMRELLPQESYDVVLQSDQEIARTGVTRTLEEVAEIDGVTRLFLTTKVPYRNALGATIGTIGIAREITEQRRVQDARLVELNRDISERKAAEKHLGQMESRYRGLLEAAPDAMVVVNQGGEIVLLNLLAEKQFGYRRDELLGQQVKNIIPEGFAERLIADGTRTAAEALAQHIGTGIELSARRKDGSAFPIEMMLSPLQSPEGILVTAAIRDISVRKAAEKRLANMEGRYRGLLEAAPDAMLLVNQAGEVVLLNVQAEKQFGYRRDELAGQLVKNIIAEGFTELLIANALRFVDHAAVQQAPTGIELHGLHKNGSSFPIEIKLSPLQTAEGILVAVAIRDITTRNKARERLLQTVAELNRSNEELGQFAYIASHDLQEPLRMVASYTQLLAKRYKGKLDSDADEFIAFAVDGANRMQRLIQDLLAYSRVGTKGKTLADTSSDKALDEAILNLRGAIEQSGALVTHDPLPTVVADDRQLIQLFQNLVGNAIKYQGPGVPRVHISSARNGGDKWVFSVKDNGLGIESQYFERIFGMFQRLHKREEFDGTGIGLAICKKIVERHGGTISVESTPGHGSTFRFALAEGGRGS